MISLTRKELRMGQFAIKNPIVRARMLLSGLALLGLLYFYGLPVFLVPMLFLVSEYGALGWALSLLLVVGVIGAVSYHGYKRTIAAYLGDARAVTPETDPELAGLFEFIEEQCDERDMPVPEVHVHPAAAVNAFAIGRRASGHVVLMDGLLATLDEQQVEAIVAHELAHLDNRHSTMLTVTNGIIRIIVTFWTWVGYTLRTGIYEYRGAVLSPAEKQAIKQNVRKRTGYVVAPINLFHKSISRHREYVADAEAVEMTDPETVSAALATVGESNENPLDHDVAASLCVLGDTSGFLSRIRSTHPPMEKRIRRIRKTFESDP